MTEKEKVFTIISEKLRFFVFYLFVQDILFSTTHELSHHNLKVGQTFKSIFSYLISLICFILITTDLINITRINNKLRKINTGVTINSKKLEGLGSRALSAVYKIDQRAGSMGSILSVSSHGGVKIRSSNLSSISNFSNLTEKNFEKKNSLLSENRTSMEIGLNENEVELERGNTRNINLMDILPDGIETKEYYFLNTDYISLLRLQSYEKKHVSLVEFFREGISPDPKYVDTFCARKYNWYFVLKSLIWIPVIICLQLFPLTQISILFLLESLFFVFTLKTWKSFRKGFGTKFVVIFNQSFFTLFLFFGFLEAFFELRKNGGEGFGGFLEYSMASLFILALLVNFLSLVLYSFSALRIIILEIKRGTTGEIEVSLEKDTGIFDNLIDDSDRYWGKREDIGSEMIDLGDSYVDVENDDNEEEKELDYERDASD